MKLKLDFSYFIRFKWGAEVINWRHGIPVNPEQKVLFKVVDGLKSKMIKAVENLIQTIKEDFEENTKLVFRGTEPDEKNEVVLEKFLISKKMSELLKKVDVEIETAKLENEGVESSDEILKTIQLDWGEYVRKLDEEIMKVILTSIEVGVDKRVIEKPKLFNFLEEEIPKDLKNILERGKKFVPFIIEDEFEAEARFKDDVLDYLVRYRKYVEGGIVINKNNYSQWLDDALDEAAVWATENAHIDFYKRVKLEARDALNTIMNRKRARSMEENGRFNIMEAVKKVMELEKGVVIENDKNNGWSLIPCKAINEAEQRMMGTMGGIEVNLSEEAVIEVIDEEIKKFECGLNGEQLSSLNKFYLKRRIQKDEVKMPFLRLTLKVHKLAEKEKNGKNFEISLENLLIHQWGLVLLCQI